MTNGHSNRLKDILTGLRKKRSAELSDLKKSGRIIAGHFCIYTPVELIETCGSVPVRIMDNGSHIHETHGSRFVRTDSCSFCKASIGSLSASAKYSCIVSGTTCDQMRRTHEIIAEKIGIPTFLFVNPRTHGKDSTKKLFYDEMLWIIEELCRLSGTIFSDDLLLERIKKWNELRGFLIRIHDLRKMDNPPISGSGMFDLIDTAFYLGADHFLEHSAEIESVINAQISNSTHNPIRIMLSGSIMATEDRMIVDMIEQDGKAVIVTDLMCTGTRWFINRVELEGNILEDLSGHYHLKMMCPHRRPNDPLFKFAEDQISEMAVQGIIYRTLKFCHPWTFEIKSFNSMFNIPLLHLDTDYSTSGTGQVRTRIQAFLEMISSKAKQLKVSH